MPTDRTLRLATRDDMAAIAGHQARTAGEDSISWCVAAAPMRMLPLCRVISRKPTGEEVSFETAELSALEGKGNRLSPEELGLLAKELAAAPDPIEAARIKERLTRGFYGI